MKVLSFAFLIAPSVVIQAWSPIGASSRRRQVLIDGFTSVAASLFIPTSLVTAPIVAQAAQQDPNAAVGLVSPKQVADLLRVVPTFSIVDPDGTPFMVVGEDAKVTCYFFTTYTEAKRILQLAKSSADKAIKAAKQQGEPTDINPWSNARISSVPLDFAVTLASKSVQSAYFRVSPAQEDVEDALEITGKKDLAEGKVPLFYFEDYTLVDNDIDGQSRTPLFFRKSELLESWKKSTKGDEQPPIKVTELFSTLTQMTAPGGTDEGLKTLVFEAPKEGRQKAKECNSKGKVPFQIGQKILVL